MNPRDYADLLKVMASQDSPEARRVKKADTLLQRLGYTQIGRYDIAHRMRGVPVLTLHGILFIRPHYYAVITAMANVLRAYKAQEDLTPLPNLDHLKLAEFIYHAPKVWWRGLDAYRAHIMTCAQAASADADFVSYGPHGPPAGRSATFAQVSGVRMTPQQPFAAAGPNVANVTMRASPMVARNTVYQVHNPSMGRQIQTLPHHGPPPPVVNLPLIDPVTTRPYETPLFTWLLEFTSRIRPLSLNSAAVV